MKGSFQRALALVLKHEGGFVNHPKDPGGATNKGVTIAVFRAVYGQNKTVDDLKKITPEQVAHIYRRNYWDKVKADELPSGLDYAVFDYAVNSGPSRAAKHLQSVLGVASDGIIGAQTIAAANALDTKMVIEQLCNKRMAFLQSLKTWRTFGKGWGRRVEDVRSAAKAMVPNPAPQPAPQKPPYSSVWQAIITFILYLFKRR